MGAIVTLAAKDLRLLWRNKFGMFWVIVFPLIMALFFGSMFAEEGNQARSLRVGFVSNPAASAQSFLAEFKKSPVLAVRVMPLDSARQLVALGKLAAYVRYFAADSVAQGFGSFMRDSIEVGIDPSRKAESEYLRGLISQAYFVRLQQQFTNPKVWRPELKRNMADLDSARWMNPQQRDLLKGVFQRLDTFYAVMDTTPAGDSATSNAKSPFSDIKLTIKPVTRTDRFPHSSWEITFPQSLLWALLGCAATFALSLVIERTRGTYLRLRLAPVSRLQILAGKGLACFIACAAVCVVLIAFGAIVFKVHIESPVLLAVAILSAAFCFVGIMMMISVLGKTEHSVAGAGWAILLMLSMIGGGMIPLMFMPAWIASLSNFSPMKWCVLAFEGAIWRGFGPAEMALPLGILLAVGLAGMIVGTRVMARLDR